MGFDYRLDPVRQVAVIGLGRDGPTLLLSDDFEETPRDLLIRHAGRNRIEVGRLLADLHRMR